MTSQPQRMRLGLVGAGRRGSQHLATVAGFADLFELAAICDVNEVNAQKAAERYEAHAYTDIRRFFETERLDVVVIVTPPEAHHLVAKVAADHHVSMLIETPLAATRAMMDFIISVSQKAGVRVEVAENMRRQPPAGLNRAAIDAGLIGRVVRVSSNYENIGQYGGYHQMSLARFYAGAEVKEVRGFERQFILGDASGVPEETLTQGLLSFENGVLGSYTNVSSWLTPLRRGAPRFISVEGTEGHILTGGAASPVLARLEGGRQVVYPVRTENSTVQGSDIPVRWFYETKPPLEELNPHFERAVYEGSFGPADAVARAKELTSIYRSVATGSPPDYSAAEARIDQELSIAISESARLGRPLPIPLAPGETEWERQIHESFREQWGGDPFEDVDRVVDNNFSTGPRRY